MIKPDQRPRDAEWEPRLRCSSVMFPSPSTFFQNYCIHTVKVTSLKITSLKMYLSVDQDGTQACQWSISGHQSANQQWKDHNTVCCLFVDLTNTYCLCLSQVLKGWKQRTGQAGKIRALLELTCYWGRQTTRKAANVIAGKVRRATESLNRALEQWPTAQRPWEGQVPLTPGAGGE